MSAETPPAFLQAGTYGAEQTRRAIASLLLRGSSIGSIVGGLVAPGDCALSPPGSGMSVNVAPGELWVPGSTSSTQSGYYCRVSSSTSLSIAASDPTNPRIDTVIAQVQDAAYAGSNNSFASAVVTGTPTSGATLSNLNGKGAVPASSLVLGYVLVPANASSIVSADLLNIAGLFASQNAGWAFSNIPGSQSTSSTSYTTLGTPDEVSVYLPANGLIRIWYQAEWQESVAGAGRAAIFIDSNQQTVQSSNISVPKGPMSVAAATNNGSAAINLPLFSTVVGLMSTNGNVALNADVTTGQAVGFLGNSTPAVYEINGTTVYSVPNNVPTAGACDVFAAAGTHTVSVQFKASSGNVSVQNRKLWARVLGG